MLRILHKFKQIAQASNAPALKQVYVIAHTVAPQKEVTSTPLTLQTIGLFKTATPLSAKENALAKLREHNLLPTELGTPSFNKRLRNVKVFFDADAFSSNQLEGPNAFSLERAISKVAAVDVGASSIGETQTGEPWRGQGYYLSLRPGDTNGLSPEERRQARNKIIASEVFVEGYGGYPHTSPYTPVKPFSAFVFTQAGIQLESPILDYQDFILDPYSQPEKYAAAREELLSQQHSTTIRRYQFLKKDWMNKIMRDPESGEFGINVLSLENVLILDTEAYCQALIKSFTLLFAASEKMVSTDKKIYFKCTLLGLGHFASINQEYSVKQQLFGIYMLALQKTLSEQKFANLGVVEVPIFDKRLQELVDLYLDSSEMQINGVILKYTQQRDVCNFDHVDSTKYHFAIQVPGDANSNPGNETGDSKHRRATSVESAIGNNAPELRYNQNAALNPHLLDPHNWYGVKINQNNFTYIDPPNTSLTMQRP